MSEHPSFEPRAEIDTVTHKLTEWATIVNTKIQEQEDKKNRCKEEYENLFPVVKAILRKRGWSEHKIIDTFDILYRRLFFEPDYKQIQDDFELNDSQVHWYRKVAVRILRELANNQLITLSDELNELLSSPNLQKKQEKLSSESLKNILIELISLTFNQFRINFTDADVALIMKKVASALVEFSSLEDLKRYISTVIKNVVSDQEKTRQSQPRILARQSERIAREEKSRTEQAEYEQNFKLAKEEFSALLSANERTRYYNKLQLLYNTIFEHKNDAELQAMFPDTSRATRDQWRKRARDFIWPNASDNLKLFLSKFTKKKFNR